MSGRRSVVLEHDPDHPERRAPQRVGVLAARRLLVDRPETHQRIELVGERDGGRDGIGRNAVARPLRLVMIFDRRRDVGGFALRLRVILAHQPLQFGEFADHFGDEIGLGELRARTARRAGSAPTSGARFFGERHDAADPLALAAQFLVKDDGCRASAADPPVGL